jgi:hypothetical protein
MMALYYTNQKPALAKSSSTFAFHGVPAPPTFAHMNIAQLPALNYQAFFSRADEPSQE